MIQTPQRLKVPHEVNEAGNYFGKPPLMSSQNHYKRNRLGKVVNQVEMSNPETRKQLRDVLEAQIKEKNQKKMQEKMQMMNA
mmetsp:Transcript_43556/g.42026  ORF Transcript_43556/g.42026 Transcript_43556/m.42026 type:complete len:82 (+) Transcript_43556:873-1118(+)